MSSSSSGNSRISSSPFLLAPLTSGVCIVCYEKDIPPLNRLAQCSECSSFYHQSCHMPALTKAILEEAGGNWYCRQCKQKREAMEAEKESVKRMPSLLRRSSGLSVTLKSNDEKALEEGVMMNKSLNTKLLQRHAAQWKSPTTPRAQLLPKATPPAEPDGRAEQIPLLSKENMSVNPKKSDDIPNPGAPEARISTQRNVEITMESSQPATKESLSSPIVTAVKPRSSSESLQQALVDGELSPSEKTFQAFSPAEAVPSIKPPEKAIPASQSSEPSQVTSDISIDETDSPPIVRPRPRKRDLVISDSEEESPPKRVKVGIPPRAAMKSATPMTRVVLHEPAPAKVSMMTASRSSKSPAVARKSMPNLASAKVAKKSGIQFRDSNSPTSERSDSIPKSKESGNERMDLRSPISPIQSDMHRISRLTSPLPAIRPVDPGASQQYSLRLLLTSGTSNDTTPSIDNYPGFDYSTFYPGSLILRQRPAPPPSAPKQRSRDKKNFDILSLVPNLAVPVLEDGKLAFREGAIDARTGQLKRGARKFKVGRIIQGELI